MTDKLTFRIARLGLMALLVSTLAIASFAKKQPKEQKEEENFPLQVHVVRVDMAQGQDGVSGGGSSDVNGNYSSRVRGGESYLYHVYIVHIDGDNRELAMTTPTKHPGRVANYFGLNIATAKNASLHLGDYKGRWNAEGSLEIQFLNEKSELKHQPFFIRAESLLSPGTTSK